VPDPIALSSDAEMRALIERALSTNYEVDREIGRGGMGVVYRARDRRLKRTVAVKVLPPELAYRGEIKSRFLREAETAAQLNHPNIVPIYSVDERDGLVYFVMACVDGTNLAKRISERGTLDPAEVRTELREVADALAYAHARGVVHRDIKPDNILLDAETGRAMVTDFGIARAVQESGDSRLTATGVAIGTPAFMSPEQAAGDRELDGRSDLYALGVVGYLALTGRLPFSANSTPAMLMKHISERPVPLSQLRPDTPPDLAASIMALLEKDPAQRFPSAGALSRALQGDTAAIPQPTHEARDPYATPSLSHNSPATVAPVVSTAPAAALAEAGAAGVPASFPTPDEIARWSAPEVRRFLTSFRKFAFWSFVAVVISIISDRDFLMIPVLMGVYMAFKYSKLLELGFDWHDVFKQPQERTFIELTGDSLDEVRGLFDKNRRQRSRVLRQNMRARRELMPPLEGMSQQAALPQADYAVSHLPGDYGVHVAAVREAEQNRADILRQVNALPRAEQELASGVIPAAEGLLERVRSLALTLAPMERTDPEAAQAEVDQQIATLEAQANPFDEKGSDARVKRLALLKRQRRALMETARQREQARAKLESCALALQNMRLDLLRLRAAGVSGAGQQITQLTERARSLAEDVDAALLGNEEGARLAATTPRRQERGQA